MPETARATVTLTTTELTILIECIAKAYDGMPPQGALDLYRELIDARMCAR